MIARKARYESIGAAHKVFHNDVNKGINFSGKFGSASTIWYPASGCRYYDVGSLYRVGSGGYWSASLNSFYAYGLYFFDHGYVGPSGSDGRAYGQAVRCVRE